MKNLKEILAGKKSKMNVTNEHHPHAHNGDNQQGTRYQCPMKCEGEKTYEKPGTCPVCNMHLAPVKNVI
jgi:Cu+-exporting ATPase